MTIPDKIAGIRRRIAAAAERAGRSADEIKLIAVSKTHPAEAIREAAAAGAHYFGENKVQEGETKIAELGRNFAEWHLIGHLQSNKARKAVQFFDVVHTVDSIELAARLERICVEEGRESLVVLAQANVSGDPRSGVDTADLAELAEFLRGCERLKFSGLMTLPPFFDGAEKTRPYFQQLRALAENLASKHLFEKERFELSMGMTNDFEVAIEEGATMVRVGTAIFGEREYGASE
ncbi:MAG TPA: YggS family pyridoxal phosphate-dependent enzyme [Pyrinomonadaceae bacterium]|nr:YggS family pyridoxal phosphate-dependent enzyme [Pyrinomonadaceae bacterium]